MLPFSNLLLLCQHLSGPRCPELNSSCQGAAAPREHGEPDVPRPVVGGCSQPLGFADVPRGKLQAWDSHAAICCLALREDLASAIPHSRLQFLLFVYFTPLPQLFYYVKTHCSI